MEPNDRQLNIPRAIAARYAHPNTDRFDELVSEGNLALAKALRSYRPGHDTTLSSWLYGSVKLTLMRVAAGPRSESARRQERTRSLAYGEDFEGPEDSRTDDRDQVDRLLGCLGRDDRKFFVSRVVDGNDPKRGRRQAVRDRVRFRRLLVKVRERAGVVA